MRSSVVLPQPDGPISTVMLSGCDVEHEVADGKELACRRRRRASSPRCGFQTGLLRQRVECRSRGCTNKYSMASMTATKASV